MAWKGFHSDSCENNKFLGKYICVINCLAFAITNLGIAFQDSNLKRQITGNKKLLR